jgi:hypothetical protein
MCSCIEFAMLELKKSLKLRAIWLCIILKHKIKSDRRRRSRAPKKEDCKQQVVHFRLNFVTLQAFRKKALDALIKQARHSYTF